MRFVLCGDQLIVTSGAVEDVAQEGGPWVLCSRSLSLVAGIALAGVWGSPSDGWMMGLLAASGLRVATFPASNMPTHHVPALRGTQTPRVLHALASSRFALGRGVHGARATPASGVSQAQPLHPSRSSAA